MTQSSVVFPYEIYDAHHHLWNLEKVHYPWLAKKGITRFFGDPTPIQKNYLIRDFKKDIGDLKVTKSVHIQVGAADDQHILESQSIQKMSDQHGLANAIVAYAALESDSIEPYLNQLLGLRNIRGVRQIIGRSIEEDRLTGSHQLINNPNWLKGLKLLIENDLSFDLQLIPEQMQDVAKLLAQIPDLKVALCHCGSPWYRDAKGWELWKEGLQKLAKLPNCMCKVSGLSMFDRHWTTDSLRPVIETVINTFGCDRVMFGSNFPVDKLHTSYSKLWLAYLEVAEGMQELKTAEIKSIFSKNCARFYSI